MKPRYVKRIIKEDFPPEVQAWIDILLFPLNQNIEQSNQILEKNVSLNDNIVATVKTINVTGSSIITANSTAGSNILQNAEYYQAFINGVTYGLQGGQKIQGVGITSNSSVLNVSGANVVISKPCLYTQTRAEFMVGGNFPLVFAHGLSVRPSVVLVVKVSDNSPLQALQTEAFSPQWDLDGNNVVIKAIPGLQAGRSYTITFLVL